jgi:diguanylate cyclase (GGDEF)-like protein
VDEALRRLERGDDPLAYATALRRAGDDVRARRVVEARVRAGDAGAREMLDACWPLDPRVERVVARAREAARTTSTGAALAWLVGDEDPRVQPWLAQLAAVVARTARPMDGAALALVAHGPEERRRRILEEASELGDLPLLTLSRVRPDADEAAALLARAGASGSTALVLTALWHVRAVRAVACADALREHVASAHPVVALEASLALAAPAPAEPVSLPGRPLRPAWAVDRPAAEARDPLTCAFTRAAFVDDPASPLMSDGPREVAMNDPVLVLDLDRTRHLNDVAGFRAGDDALREVTRLLQIHVGDRVARWAGDKWLVRLEGDVDSRDVAERLVVAVRGTQRTVSIGLGRSETWVQAIVRAEAACHEAKAAGGDAVREVS